MYKINPFKITDYNRSDADLQTLIIFCVSVAGKKATTISEKVYNFLNETNSAYGKETIEKYGSNEPFNLLKILIEKNELVPFLKKVKLGKYSVLEKAFTQLSKISNIKNIELNDLENIHGIGQKTSRFFLVHSRLNQKFAVLDTHILAHLRSNGIKAPKSTPSSKTAYSQLEKIVLKMAEKAGMSMAAYDLSIWKSLTKSKA